MTGPRLSERPVFPPRPGWLPGRNRRSAGWFPRSPDHRSVREAPSSTRQHRHGYAAGRHRGLPTAGTKRLRSRTHPGVRALHTGPYPPGGSRLRGYGAPSTDSLTLHLLTSLDEPAPSGSTDTARLLGAACHRSPPFPAIGWPDASSGRCDGPTETVSHHLPVHPAPRGAHSAPEESRGCFQDLLVI